MTPYDIARLWYCSQVIYWLPFASDRGSQALAPGSWLCCTRLLNSKAAAPKSYPTVTLTLGAVYSQASPVSPVYSIYSRSSSSIGSLSRSSGFSSIRLCSLSSHSIRLSIYSFCIRCMGSLSRSSSILFISSIRSFLSSASARSDEASFDGWYMYSLPHLMTSVSFARCRCSQVI